MPYSTAIVAQIDQNLLVVPPHWFFEVANMLLVAMRRKRITDAGRVEALRQIAAIEVTVDMPSLDQASRDSFDIAVNDGLTLYDAAYLELARRLGCDLLTLDAPLAAAARARGINTPLLP